MEQHQYGIHELVEHPTRTLAEIELAQAMKYLKAADLRMGSHTHGHAMILLEEAEISFGSARSHARRSGTVVDLLDEIVAVRTYLDNLRKHSSNIRLPN